MNEFDPRAEVALRRIDAGLAETLGRECAPDVTEQVLAALHEAPAISRPSRRRAWMSAAALLLGTLAVVTTWLAQRQRVIDENAPAADSSDLASPQEPGWFEVTDAKTVGDVPAIATAVRLRNLGDASVQALLVRCPSLQHLSIFCSTLLRRAEDPADPVSITDAAFSSIAKFGSLRSLYVEGCDAITGAKMGELAALPMLETLSLRFCDTSDEGLLVLPRLPSLRSLDLHGNHGFGEAGLRAIGDCAGLTRLSLSGCGQLASAWLAPLDRLRNLTELDLSGFSSFRGIGVGLAKDRESALSERVRTVLAEREEHGYGFERAAIRRWPSLRVLDLGGCIDMTEFGRVVDSNQNGRPDPADFAKTAELRLETARAIATDCPSVRTLILAHGAAVDDEFVRAILAMPSLRILDLSNCSRLTAACVGDLVAARQIREVRFAEAEWLTLELAGELLAAGKHVTNTRAADRDYEAELRLRTEARRMVWSEYPRYTSVREPSQLALLSRGVAHVELVGLGDQAALALSKRGGVRGLAFVVGRESSEAGNEDGITDLGMSLVAEIPTLEELTLRGDHAVTARGFAAIARLRGLRKLELIGVTKITDADVVALLRELKELRSLSLNACYRVTDGVIDAIVTAPSLERFDATALPWMDQAVERRLAKAKPGLAIQR